MVGLVFSKLSRPQLRTKTVIFSQRAVITLRNRRLFLIFRIGDLRDDNFVLGTQVDIGLPICCINYRVFSRSLPNSSDERSQKKVKFTKR